MRTVIRELWLRATYRTAPRPHPYAERALARMRGRRTQDELEGWR